MKKIALLLALLLTACAAPTIKTTPGNKAGDYHVSQFFIESGAEVKNPDGFARGTPDEVREFKQLAAPLIVERLNAHSSGNDVGMTITVNEIHLNISKAMAIFWPDAVQVHTVVTLWKPDTREVIGTVPVVVISKVTSGLLGVAIDAMDSQTGAEAKQKLAKEYAEALEKALYPGK